jgi:nicotinate-nucleotide adenylyltransferase
MKDVQKKIGLYGGSFDPIHFGHIYLALQIKELLGLDEIIFCPTNITPHKKNILPGKHRFNMTKLAIEDIDGLSVSDCEIKRQGVSYTINTINDLIQIYPNLRLILGLDLLSTFESWKGAKEIAKLSSPIVGSRFGDYEDVFDNMKNMEVANILKKGLVKTKIMDISSTEIRNRIKNKLYCNHLLPSKVLDYITEHKLY